MASRTWLSIDGRLPIVVVWILTGQPVIAQDPGLVTATSSLFSGSGNCTFCHESDGTALRTPSGLDLSIPTDWRSTMMAHASRDPFWQAMVEKEITEHPSLRETIEDKCTTCHAPMGRTQAIHDGADSFSMNSAVTTALSRDGVSCTLCHQLDIADNPLPDSFSGHYSVVTNRVTFGPYPSPFTGPMQNQVQYTPEYGPHVGKSELCAPCHTLFTPTVDAAGEIVGEFPEQTPYLEWENSDYPARSVECQTCHMPRVDDPVRISTRPRFVETRSPFFRHEFVGGNAYMLGILQEAAAEIETNATQTQLHDKQEETRAFLRGTSVKLTSEAGIVGEVLELRVTIDNLCGHKFPTGFPSRRAWLHVTLRDEIGAIFFESGAHDESGEIVGLLSDYEPHHEVITTENEVQIYESVMEDTDGQVTVSLLRATHNRKDNRLPPLGFRSDVAGYEDIAIVGAAVADANFNATAGTEGSGRDTVTYRVPFLDQAGEVTVEVQLLFQTVTPRFLDALRSLGGPAGERLLEYAQAVPPRPEVIADSTLTIEVGSAQNQVTFRRGDANEDGRHDISDAVAILGYLFTGMEGAACQRAADSNGSAVIDITDAVYLLSHLFLAGAAPPPPYPDCGSEPEEMGLPCTTQPVCR